MAADEEEHILEVSSRIRAIYPPIILLVGVTLNVLCILVWLRQLNRAPVVVFLFTLAILDTVALFNEPFFYLLHFWLKDEHRDVPYDDCWVFIMIQNFVNVCSGWLVFFICFIQACGLCVPDRKVISKNRAMLIVLIVFIFSLTVNQHFMNYEDIRSSKTRHVSPLLRCGEAPNTGEKSFWGSFKWKWIDKLSGCMFPVTLTMACVIAIIQVQKIYQNSRINMDSLIIRGIRFKQLAKYQRDLNKIAVVIGLTYIISIVPITIYRVKVPEILTVKQELANTLLSLLGHLNITCKFIYCYRLCTAFQNCTIKLLKECGTRKFFEGHHTKIDAIGLFDRDQETVRLKVAEFSVDGTIQLEISGFGDSEDSPSSPNQLSFEF